MARIVPSAIPKCGGGAPYTGPMRSSRHDPLRLDVAAFAADGKALEGDWPGATLQRLASLQVPPQDLGQAAVHWRVQGERRAKAGSPAELWLTLSVQAPVWLTCQRCLQPMAVDLALERRLRFVHGESQAEALDAESDDDVLALPRWLDLRELVEDELLLGLPLVPRHETCPQPLPVPIHLEDDSDEAVGQRPHDADGAEDAEAGTGTTAASPQEGETSDTLPDGRPNPFAVLKQLKKREGGAGR